MLIPYRGPNAGTERKITMRFEKLSFSEKIDFLKVLHTELNNDLFGGELEEIPIDIANLDPGKNRAWAIYRPALPPIYNTAYILFDHGFLDYIEHIRTIQEQAERLTQIMLHEMIHQYCEEKNISADGHDEKWQEEALKHGLYSKYDNEEPKAEHIDKPAWNTWINAEKRLKSRKAQAQ